MNEHPTLPDLARQLGREVLEDIAGRCPDESGYEADQCFSCQAWLEILRRDNLKKRHDEGEFK